MKKIFLLSLLISTPILATTPAAKTASTTTNKTKTATTKTALTAAQQKLQEAQQKLAAEKEDLQKAAVEQAQAVVHLDKTKRSLDMGIQPVVDIINATDQPLTLYGQSQSTSGYGMTNQVLKQNIPGHSVQAIEIPAGVEYVYVNSDSQSKPVPLANGVQVISVSLLSDIGSFSYGLTPLTPQYGNHVLIYNGSKDDQTARLTFESTTLWSSVKAFFGASSNTQEVNLIYSLAPNTTTMCAIPPFANATTLSPISITQAKFGIKNGSTWATSDKPLTIQTNDHNTFMITPDGNLIQSQ